MKLSFARKTTFAFASLSLLGFMIGGIGVLANKLILEDLRRFSNDLIGATDALLQLDRDLHQALIAQLYLASSDLSDSNAFVQESDENTAQVETRWKAFKTISQTFATAESRELESAFESHFASWKDSNASVIENLLSPRESDRSAGLRLLKGEARAHFDAARDKVDLLTAILEAEATRIKNDSERHARSSLVTIIGIALASLVIGGIMTWKIGYATSKRLRTVASRLKETANGTAETSSQISSSSHRVAEGASEQAASLEETSASLEENASSIRKSAEAAQGIKSVASETLLSAQNGRKEMESMIEAMRLIDDSSKNIAVTLKTIDEIAFQTNLLALNAAVEAARAGEAGAGFAVVADEVRALAQRCAEAARETSIRLNESSQRSEVGLQTSARVAEKLEQICDKASEMDELMQNLATSSQEQSAGITQLNQALNQMDQVTQSNAASAEETASATVQLDTQVTSLHRMVEELSSILGIHNAVTRRRVPNSEHNKSTNENWERLSSRNISTHDTKLEPSRN